MFPKLITAEQKAITGFSKKIPVNSDITTLFTGN